MFIAELLSAASNPKGYQTVRKLFNNAAPDNTTILFEDFYQLLLGAIKTGSLETLSYLIFEQNFLNYLQEIPVDDLTDKQWRLFALTAIIRANRLKDKLLRACLYCAGLWAYKMLCQSRLKLSSEDGQRIEKTLSILRALQVSLSILQTSYTNNEITLQYIQKTLQNSTLLLAHVLREAVFNPAGFKRTKELLAKYPQLNMNIKMPDADIGYFEVTLMHEVLRFGSLDCIQYYLQDNLTPPYDCLYIGSMNTAEVRKYLVDYFRDNCEDKYIDKLTTAIILGEIETVKAILKKQPDTINWQDSYSQTAVFWAGLQGPSTPIFSLIYKHITESITQNRVFHLVMLLRGLIIHAGFLSRAKEGEEQGCNDAIYHAYMDLCAACLQADSDKACTIGNLILPRVSSFSVVQQRGFIFNYGYVRAKYPIDTNKISIEFLYNIAVQQLNHDLRLSQMCLNLAYELLAMLKAEDKSISPINRFHQNIDVKLSEIKRALSDKLTASHLLRKNELAKIQLMLALMQPKNDPHHKMMMYQKGLYIYFKETAILDLTADDCFAIFLSYLNLIDFFHFMQTEKNKNLARRITGAIFNLFDLLSKNSEYIMQKIDSSAILKWHEYLLAKNIIACYQSNRSTSKADTVNAGFLWIEIAKKALKRSAPAELVSHHEWYHLLCVQREWLKQAKSIDEVAVERVEDEILGELACLSFESLTISMLEFKYLLHLNKLKDVAHQKQALDCRKRIYALNNTPNEAYRLMRSFVAYQGLCKLTDEAPARANYAAAFMVGANALLAAYETPPNHRASSPLDETQKRNLIDQLKIAITELYKSLQLAKISNVTNLCYALCSNLKDLLYKDGNVYIQSIRKAIANIDEAILVVNTYHSTETDVSLCRSLAVLWLRFCQHQNALNVTDYQINFYGVINDEPQYKEYIKQALTTLLQVPKLKDMIAHHPRVRQHSIFALAKMQQENQAANATMHAQANQIGILQAQLLQQASGKHLRSDDERKLRQRKMARR